MRLRRVRLTPLIPESHSSPPSPRPRRRELFWPCLPGALLLLGPRASQFSRLPRPTPKSCRGCNSPARSARVRAVGTWFPTRRTPRGVAGPVRRGVGGVLGSCVGQKSTLRVVISTPRPRRNARLQWEKCSLSTARVQTGTHTSRLSLVPLVTPALVDWDAFLVGLAVFHVSRVRGSCPEHGASQFVGLASVCPLSNPSHLARRKRALVSLRNSRGLICFSSHLSRPRSPSALSSRRFWNSGTRLLGFFTTLAAPLLSTSRGHLQPCVRGPKA